MSAITRGYDTLFAGVRAWSHKQGETSDEDRTFRATLYLSSMQLANCLAAWLFFEALSDGGINFSRVAIIVFAGGLLAANIFYSSRRRSSIELLSAHADTRRVCGRVAFAYLTGTVLVLVSAATLLYQS